MELAHGTTAHGTASTQLVGGAIEIVKTYLAGNVMEPAKVPDFIRQVFGALATSAGLATAADGSEATLGTEQVDGVEAETAPVTFSLSKVPVIPVEESVQPDGIVCLFDGVKKLMLKRHIRARYGMEWEDYLRHFDLPSDYPSVASGYSQEKSRVAKSQGLGRTIDKTPKDRRKAPAKERVAA